MSTIPQRTTIRHDAEHIEEALRVVTNYLQRQGLPLRVSTTENVPAITPLVEYAVGQLARDIAAGRRIPPAQWQAWAEIYSADVSQGKARTLELSEGAHDAIRRIGEHMEGQPVQFQRLSKLMKGRPVYNNPLIVTCALLYVAAQIKANAEE